MSIATVHYLSMNTPSGRLVQPTVLQAASGTYTASSLAPSTSHTIVWGDATANTVVSTDSNGNLSTTHTYTLPGTYTIVITETTGGRQVGREVQSVGTHQGTLTIPGSITHAVSAAFSGSGFDVSGPFSIAWGDGTANTTGTSTAGGLISSTNHTYVNAGTYTIVVTFSGVQAATGTAVAI